MTVHSGRVALLRDNGDVVVYETSNFDDNGRIIPVTVAQNAAHIVYASNEPTDLLIVTLQDGTVWTTGVYKDRWKLKEQVSGLSGIVRTSIYGNAEDLSEGSMLSVLTEAGYITRTGRTNRLMCLSLRPYRFRYPKPSLMLGIPWKSVFRRHTRTGPRSKCRLKMP